MGNNKYEPECLRLMGYEGLGLAIVERGILDYANARYHILKMKMYKDKYIENYKKKLTIYDTPEEKYYHEMKKHQHMIDECTNFFKSQWYHELCDMDGTFAISMAEKRAKQRFKEYVERVEKVAESGGK